MTTMALDQTNSGTAARTPIVDPVSPRAAAPDGFLPKSGTLRGLIVAPYGIRPAHEGNKAHTEAHIRQLKNLGHEIWYLGLGPPPEEAAPMDVWRDRFIHAPFLHEYRRKPLAKTIWNFVRRGVSARV